MQDLTRGIHKILDDEKPVVKETVVVNGGTGISIQPLLERGYLSLESGEWDRANEFFEQVLNRDAKNTRAYRSTKSLA